MTETKSTRYRKQSLAGREILDGLASATPKLPSMLKAKRRNAKTNAEVLAKKSLSKQRIAFTFRIKR